MDSALIRREDILKAAGTIEPLPASITRLLQVVSEDDYDASKIVEIVAIDPALTGDVLARANSAASGSQRLIGDLRQAAARIGANAVVEIAVRRTMRGRLDDEIEAYGLGPNELWRHAITASVAADVIRRAASKPVAPMITTAALVHDIGKVVIASCLPPSLTDALVQASETDDIDLSEVEREVIGIDHGEVGGQVVRMWGLPVSVQVALMQHHGSETGDTFTHALILADRMAHAARELVMREPVEEGEEGEEGEEDVEEDTTPLLADATMHADLVGIPVTRLPALVAETADLATDIVALYSE